MIVLNPPEDSPLYLEVPCVVLLSQPPGAAARYYGPFENLKTAREWVDEILFTNPYMSFGILPLRRTDRDRTSNEWYGYDQVELEDFIDLSVYDEELQDANDRIIDV